MSRNLRILALSLALAPGVGSTSGAQSPQPHFSGSWSLDVEKSTQGPAVPSALKMDIKLNGSVLEVHRVATTPNGDSEASFKYKTDGTPSTNQVKQGPMQFDARSIVAWKGELLAFDTKIVAGEQEVVQRETWALSPDGATLTIKRSMTVGGQEVEATLVLNRTQG